MWLVARTAGAVDVAYANLVSTPEAFFVVVAEGAVDVRMTVFVAIVDVGRAMIAEVFTSAFDTIMEATASGVLEL